MMNTDNLLRDYARQELQRFCPPAHYWLRDHDPKADRELVEPLLREPVRFGLTPRERVAADALSALAIYEVRSRAIWSEAFPVRDSDDVSVVEPMPQDQEREIYGRREVFRRSALVYARMLNDVQLIELYQCETPMPGVREVAPTDDVVPERADKSKVSNAEPTGEQQNRPLQRQPFQEQEILRVLMELGYDPEALPRLRPGKSGPRSAARSLLSFSTVVFDKAWQRLRDQERVKER